MRNKVSQLHESNQDIWDGFAVRKPGGKVSPIAPGTIRHCVYADKRGGVMVHLKIRPDILKMMGWKATDKIAVGYSKELEAYQLGKGDAGYKLHSTRSSNTLRIMFRGADSNDHCSDVHGHDCRVEQLGNVLRVYMPSTEQCLSR